MKPITFIVRFNLKTNYERFHKYIQFYERSIIYSHKSFIRLANVYSYGLEGVRLVQN